MDMMKPTKEDLEDLPRVWVTSREEPWDPTIVDRNDISPIPSCYQPGDWIHFDVNSASKDVQELEEMDYFAKKFAAHHQVFRLMATILGVTALVSAFSNVYKNALKVLAQVSESKKDYSKYRDKLLYFKADDVENTFKHTTQYALNVPDRHPMKNHVKQRFGGLNRPRIGEMVCADTLFGSTKAFGGITCAQLFVGKESKYTAVYGMKHERDGPEAFEDFIRDKGAPFCIRSDNSKMQTGNKWRCLMRKYNIWSENTEPHHPNQNPAE